MRLSHAASAAALAIALPFAAAAQSFPSKPVTLVVPWPAGGTTDIHMRTLATATEKHMGQPIIVENKAGAAGTMGGATMAATARPDGYTVGQLPVTIFRLPYMQKTSWDPTKDFTYIIHLTGYLFGTMVRADSPWKTWKEFIAYAKANPGKVTYSTPGTGSTLHITMEQIALHQGIKWTQVPFKGQAEQTAALLGSHTMAAASGPGGNAAQIESGDFRALVIWSEKRSRRWPDVPTLVEEGQPIVSTSPYGLAGPRGIPPAVVKVLHDAFKKGMEEPEHRAFVEKWDQTWEYLNSADYEKFVAKTIQEQRELVTKLGLAQK